MELRLKLTYFRLSNTFYEQVEGAAMGLLLSLIVASLYMEAFERNGSWRHWHRNPISGLGTYVDDVFTIWPHGDPALDEFLTHLNSQHPAIQFTMEKIAFLDVQIERTEESAHTSAFRKKTHTNQYITYKSHHHNRITTGVIQCLATIAEKICHPIRFPQEGQHQRAVFQANSYPTHVVVCSLGKHCKPLLPKALEQPTLHLAYVKGVTERIERMCRHQGVKTTFQVSGNSPWSPGSHKAASTSTTSRSLKQSTSRSRKSPPTWLLPKPSMLIQQLWQGCKVLPSESTYIHTQDKIVPNQTALLLSPVCTVCFEFTVSVNISSTMLFPIAKQPVDEESAWITAGQPFFNKFQFARGIWIIYQHIFCMGDLLYYVNVSVRKFNVSKRKFSRD